MRRAPSRVVTWLHERPVAVDVAVAVLACAPLLAALIYWFGDVGWGVYPLIAITGASLMVRRRWPFAVLITVAATCALSPLVHPGFDFTTVPFAFALYTVASLQRTRRALIGYAIALLVSVLATIPYSLSGSPPPLVSLTDPFSLIALVVGILVKNRRDHDRWLTETVNQRIENAALAERTRIAAEMHDVVAHSLTIITTLAGGAASSWKKHPDQALGAVEQISTVGREALDEMHRTLKLLRSTDATLDTNLHHSGGNLPTLDELADGFRHAGLPVTLTRSGPPIPMDAGLRHAIYRIVQEALTNTLRHAESPSEANVTIEHHEYTIELVISDDGKPTTRRRRTGEGLIGIRQRAATLGGYAESGPDGGGGWRTCVVLRTPETSGRGKEPSDEN